MPNFTFADFYLSKAIQAAERLAESAAAFIADPTGANAARLRLDMDHWADAQAVRRATECHKL